jgi:hypothetical protein
MSHQPASMPCGARKAQMCALVRSKGVMKNSCATDYRCRPVQEGRRRRVL